MQIAVYDTYVQRPEGTRMHFDILVPADTQDHARILDYGRRYLAAKGIAPTALEARRCNYCHIESASPAVEQEVMTTGFAILELENC